MKRSTMYIVFAVSMSVFVICGLFCFFNRDVLIRKPFQSTSSFMNPALAKYEKDGNLYVIDSGLTSFDLPPGSYMYDTLIVLRIEDNQLKNLDNIIDFTKLECLNIESNPIKSLEQFKVARFRDTLTTLRCDIEKFTDEMRALFPQRGTKNYSDYDIQKFTP